MRSVTKFVLIAYLRAFCDLVLLGSICVGFVEILWLAGNWTDPFERTVGWAGVVAAIALAAGLFTYLIIALTDAENRFAEEVVATRGDRH